MQQIILILTKMLRKKKLTSEVLKIIGREKKKLKVDTPKKKKRKLTNIENN